MFFHNRLFHQVTYLSEDNCPLLERIKLISSWFVELVNSSIRTKGISRCWWRLQPQYVLIKFYSLSFSLYVSSDYGTLKIFCDLSRWLLLMYWPIQVIIICLYILSLYSHICFYLHYEKSISSWFIVSFGSIILQLEMVSFPRCIHYSITWSFGNKL